MLPEAGQRPAQRHASLFQESEAQALKPPSGASADPSPGLGGPGSGGQAVWGKSATLYLPVRLVGLTQTDPARWFSPAGWDPQTHSADTDSEAPAGERRGQGSAPRHLVPRSPATRGPDDSLTPPGRWWGRVSRPTPEPPWRLPV